MTMYEETCDVGLSRRLGSKKASSADQRKASLRTARQQVRLFEDQSADLLREHHRAMECRDCEDSLQLGIEAFTGLSGPPDLRQNILQWE